VTNVKNGISDVSTLSCREDSGDYYVLVQGGDLTIINPEDIWTDLTSKLRVS